jgi:hypothetical protein
VSLPIFSAGTARGGTNLMVKMLSVLPGYTAAMDPLIPLFKQYRNDILSTSTDAEIREALNPEAPLDDYYYDPVKARAMHEIQNADLSQPYNSAEHAALVERMRPRTLLSSANLAAHLDELSADTYKGVFDNALRLIDEAAGAGQRQWAGIHENWGIEFFAPLARSYPEAKFMIMLRDPRACIASALRVSDPRIIPHVLSFARNWRKAAAFTQHYLRDPLFKDRILFIRYEDLVQDPQTHAQTLCQFLDLEFNPAMLDPRNFKDPSGGRWKGNSHQGAAPDRIYTSSLEAWKKSMSREQIWTIELACDPEMRHLGYTPWVFNPETPMPAPSYMEFLDRDNKECLGWRVGTPDAERDFDLECLRKDIAANEAEGRTEDCLNRVAPDEQRHEIDGWLTQNFLFPEALAALKELNYA